MQESIRHFEKAMLSDPNDPALYANLGNLGFNHLKY